MAPSSSAALKVTKRGDKETGETAVLTGYNQLIILSNAKDENTAAQVGCDAGRRMWLCEGSFGPVYWAEPAQHS